MADVPAVQTTPSPALTVMGAAAQLQKLASSPEDTPDEEKETPKESVDGDEAPAQADLADSDDTDPDADPQEDPKPKPKTHKVKIDDEEIDVDEDELKRGYQRQKDYTKKTQELAEKRKASESDEAARREDRKVYAERLKTLDDTLDQMLPKEPDWTRVRAEDPDNFPRLHAEWQVLKERRAELTAERKRVTDAEDADRKTANAAFATAEAKKLAAALPDLIDNEKGPKLHESMVRVAAEYGFTAEDVDNTVDSRYLILLHDAMQYRKLKVDKAALEKKTADEKKLTPTLPAGTTRAVAPVDKEVKNATDRVRQTGSIQDAAAAIAALNKKSK